MREGSLAVEGRIHARNQNCIATLVHLPPFNPNERERLGCNE